jgi:hypothetical protein
MGYYVTKFTAGLLSPYWTCAELRDLPRNYLTFTELPMRLLYPLTCIRLASGAGFG